MQKLVLSKLKHNGNTRKRSRQLKYRTGEAQCRSKTSMEERKHNLRGSFLLRVIVSSERKFHSQCTLRIVMFKKQRQTLKYKAKLFPLFFLIPATKLSWWKLHELLGEYLQRLMQRSYSESHTICIYENWKGG